VGEAPEGLPFALEEPPLDAGLIVAVVKRSVRLSLADKTIPLSGPDQPVVEELPGDLLVMYAFDLPGRFVFLARRHREALSLEQGDLRQLSVRNLVKRRPKPKIRQTDRTITLILDGDLEASLLLVDMLWEQLAPRIPGDLVAAVPARDTIAVTGTGLDGGVSVLSYAARQIWESPRVNRKLLLTPSLMIRRGNTWQLLEPGSA
jgi:hypothetical protein